MDSFDHELLTDIKALLYQIKVKVTLINIGVYVLIGYLIGHFSF